MIPPPSHRSLVRWLSALAFFAASAAHPLAVADNASYNMPTAVTGTMEPNAAMVKMETPVKPEVLAAFQKSHPAKFWVFGEDRQLAVRNRIIPAHWFEDGAKQYQRFAGVARPGEFYVFQVCVVPGAERPRVDCMVSVGDIRDVRPVVISGSPCGWTDSWSSLVFDDARYRMDGPVPVMPIWIGLPIPGNATSGTIQGKVMFSDPHLPVGSVERHPPFDEQLSFSIRVEGAPVSNSGVDDAWRLARLQWLDSYIGFAKGTSPVLCPFNPVKTSRQERIAEILGRRMALGSTGIPSQISGYFSASNTRILGEGQDAFSSPPRLECLLGGRTSEWKMHEFDLRDDDPLQNLLESAFYGCGMGLEVQGKLEFDGHLALRMILTTTDLSSPDVALDDVRFIVPWNNDVAKYAMGLGLQGGLCPPKHEWKWDVTKHQDAVWIGDVNLGAMMRFKGSNFRRPLINAYYDFQPLNLPDSWGGGGIRWERDQKTTTLVANSGPVKVTPRMKGQGGLEFNIDWYLTPFKPLDVRKHFTDRYFHASQGGSMEDTAKLKAEGANILEIHHNRLCNPYINYPYNDDSFGNLKDFIKKAHGDGMRVAIYYTTRELTQNLPEFFALKSMAGEIILPRRDGVAWPVTNSKGPHPWLLQHVGEDIVPAWRENLKFPDYKQKLDLAVITTPDSRWNNFYLEGLDYLVKKAGIDGLYIDDTALDRESMQRARRILDADGNTGRRVSMHSWNHFNGLAKWSNSAIAFMELFPYYDGLWYGEGFNANASPEYMLVEMSGIPFGLMSEMLDHPNAWHGMVFGMRTRWPWSGDPRPIWKLEDLFGITDSEFIGWWDPACPVKIDNPLVKASVFKKAGKVMVALGSWEKKAVKVKLVVDWKSLGLDPKRTTFWAPACDKVQSEAVFASDAAIPVKAGQGWIFIADEQPRQITALPESFDPIKDKRLLGGTETAFDLKVPANTVSTKDLPWPQGATVATARLDPMQDEGQSWGVGLAVGWADGKHVQINARTDGNWGVHRNGNEELKDGHPRGKPAVVAVLLLEKTIQVMAKEDDGDWETVAEFPRADFPGSPATIRYGKLGQSWVPRDYGQKGGTNPCRVEWVRVY